MDFKYIDIHSHINLEPLNSKKDEVISRLVENKIFTITVGVDFDTSKLAIDFAERNPNIFRATVGLHPNDNVKEIFDYEKYLELARHEYVVAIGECGLDYYRLKGSEEEKENEIKRQKELFKKHIAIAKESNLPLMIHSRPHVDSMDAYLDVIHILEQESFVGHVNFHFFVGDICIAKKIVEHGWSVSYDGPITFSKEYDEVIKWLPLENIMAETDAPFAAPMPYRSKTCEPYMVVEVYKKISEIKELDINFVRKQIIENTKRIFKI